MDRKKEKTPPILWKEAENSDVAGCNVVNPGPLTLYKGPACPVSELPGQREYFGGPSVVRVTPDYGKAKRITLEESAECEELEKQRRELKAPGVKVAGRKQTCKPRIHRVETGMEKAADCADKEPDIAAKTGVTASVTAMDEGTDAAKEPKISKD